MDHGAQDDVDGSLHAASVIRALRKKRAAVVNNTPLPDAQTVPLNPHNSHEREDNYLGGAGSRGLLPVPRVPKARRPGSKPDHRPGAEGKGDTQPR